MGVQGASKKANMPLPVRNCRIWIRSAKARDGLAPLWLSWDSKLALNTLVLSCSSSRTPERTSSRARSRSATAITANRNSVSNDTATSVNSLWLAITRS